MRAGPRARRAAPQLRFSARKARVAPPPWQKLLFRQQRAKEYRRSTRDAPEALGNARKPQCVLSRNSILRGATSVRDKRQEFPRPGRHGAAKKSPPPALRNRK